MLISTKGRYALRIMIELSQHSEDSYLSLPVISENQGISKKYLENIISNLVKANLVEGVRGKNGGYRLTRELKDYSVGEILRLTEGSLSPVSCVGSNGETCPRANQCYTLPLWERLDNLINNYLDGVTLADLLNDVK